MYVYIYRYYVIRMYNKQLTNHSASAMSNKHHATRSRQQGTGQQVMVHTQKTNRQLTTSKRRWFWANKQQAKDSKQGEMGNEQRSIYIYIYLHIYISEVGDESNRKIISFRSCVCVQLYVRSEWISKNILPLFTFPFWPWEGFLPFSPCEIMCSRSLEMNETKGSQVRSIESK